jgi:threonine/homoserine/homoserine lactone efflux protein
VGTLFAETMPLALAAAISPVLFLLQLTILTGPRPLARGMALAVGAAVPLALVTALVVAVGSSSASLSGDPTVSAVVDLSLGCLLLGLGAWTLVRTPKPKAPKPPHEPSLGRAFVLGIVGMATNVSTFALYLPALKLISASRVGAADQAFIGAIVFLIVLSFVLVPLLLASAVPASRRVLTRLGEWMSAHHRALNVGLLFAFGAFLVIKGARGL